MKKFLGFICLIYDAIIIYVWYSNLLKNYLAPNMQIYIKVSVIPLFIIALVLLFSKNNNKTIKVSDFILLLPVVFIILSGNGRLTETLASNKIIKIDNLSINDVIENKNEEVNNEEVNDDEPVKEDIEVIDLTNIDFEIKDETYDYLANYFTTKEQALKFNGNTIKVRGFVVTNDFMPKGHFALGKYSISCCAADATYVGYIAKYDMDKIEDNKWYEIEGVLEKTPWPSGNDILVINVKNIKEIPSNTEEQYVYPCYSYDDGTCKDLMKYNLE